MKQEGRNSMKFKVPSISPLLLLFFSNLLFPLSLGEKNVCVSQGGRFPPFANEGQNPKKAPKGSRDLTLCRIFRHNTCCDITQTYPTSLSIRKLASTGEGSTDCLHLWELLECSICDPTIGTRSGPPLICASFCDMVFDACHDAYFSLDIKIQVLSPCGLNDIVCGKLGEWVSNGTELCRVSGFSVQKNSDDVNSFCYGGKESLGSIADSWKSSERGSAFNARTASKGFKGGFKGFKGFKDRVISEKVSWAIGGMVLTAGLVYISKRKSYNQRRRQAAVNRTARMVETRLSRFARNE